MSVETLETLVISIRIAAISWIESVNVGLITLSPPRTTDMFAAYNAHFVGISSHHVDPPYKLTIGSGQESGILGSGSK